MPRPLVATFAVLVAYLLAHAAAQPLGSGQLRPRPGEGREPEAPPPSIREYKPRSTLVVPQHQVPRAKFPVIDVHGHPPQLTGPDVVERVVETMNPLNLRVMVNANSTSGDQLREATEAIRASRTSDRMVMFTGVDFRDVGPGTGRRLALQLEADVKEGARGVGEIPKDFGLRLKKSDGSRLRLDDVELDPVWETAARLNIPVFIHVADPEEFFRPFDYRNERWLELALYPERRYQDRSQFPSFEELMVERDRLLARHPRTTFILAHLGWHANDLARLAAIFDRMPNVYAEVGAVLYDIGRQPRTAHDFFVKYQDRILFGKDSYQPDEYPYYWRVLETRDEYFDYYRDYHAFWKLYGIGLPDPVLRKLYYANALKVIPGLPRTALQSNPPFAGPKPRLVEKSPTPHVAVASAVYTALGGGHLLRAVTGSGEFLTLEDGSVWQVDPKGRFRTAQWKPGSGISVRRADGEGGFAYELQNIDADEGAPARYLPAR